MAPGWPVTLSAGEVGLRPLRLRDASDFRAVRRRNTAWLTQWEATSPIPGDPGGSFFQMVRSWSAEAREGRMMPFAVTLKGRFVGQVTVGGIAWGSARSGYIGYWVDQQVAGRGVIPTAVALATDHCFTAGLHRIEINIRPENTASLRVVEKLGFRDEGLRQRYLHIDGDWRDHRTFALTAEEVAPTGLLARWRAAGGGASVLPSA
jgi:ribosomal-protein-alanine N-acetyltransferase